MHAKRLIRPVILAALVGGAAGRPAAAQEAPRSLLQLEVRDSIGLPLPDATVEVYAMTDRAAYRKWVRVEAAVLSPGIHLLRLSHPGYRSAVFSVPLADGDPVSLRVRLHPGNDSTLRRSNNQAARIDAIGLEVDGGGNSDIIGDRRVIDRSTIEWASRSSIAELLRAIGGTRLFVRHPSGCRPPVVVNGDKRRPQSFAVFDQFSRPDDIEVLEVFPSHRPVPPRYQPFGTGCGLVVAWVRRR
jgi:hypothetical protein